MSNPLKKTMVYLGLADEEEVYEEQPAAAAPRREKPVVEKTAPVTPLHRPAVVRQPSAGAATASPSSSTCRR